MTIPKARVAKNAPAPLELTPEEHARIDVESTAAVKELDERYRKMEQLPTEPVVMRPRIPLSELAFGPQVPADYRPELRWSERTPEEQEKLNAVGAEMKKLAERLPMPEFRTLTDAEVDEIAEEMRTARREMAERFEAIEGLPAEKLRMRVR